MRSFEFCENFPPFRSFGRLVGPSLGKEVDCFAQERGQGGLPLVSLPLWGREGVTLIASLKKKKR